MRPLKKIALVGCSDGQKIKYKDDIDRLIRILNELGLEVDVSRFIYDKGEGLSGTGRERANALNEFYRNKEIDAIFDISGGNLANDTLDHLDYEQIKKSEKIFFGYSDLSVILNSIYSQTGRPSVLYQIRNLVYKDGERQIENFKRSILGRKSDLFKIRTEFVRGERMEGIVLGGNLRTLLKLAGTRYWPDFKDKILLIEGYAGRIPQIITYYNQLKHIGVFRQISGIVVGTFTEMEENKVEPGAEQLILDYIPENLPVCKTFEIGHNPDSKAIVIGKYMEFHKE